MHESAKRIYALAAELRPGIEKQGEVAALIGVSQQALNNWETRGVSKIAALKLQSKTQINATWLLEGKGPMLIGPWPFLGISPKRWGGLWPTQRTKIEGTVTEMVEGYEAINRDRPSGGSSTRYPEERRQAGN